MTGLERTYRRLIRLYPIEHQRTYGEEMLGVLIADSAPGQRRPGAAQFLDLVVSAFRLRLGSARTTLQSGHWRQAAGVFTLIAALVLTAEHLRPLLGDYALSGSLRWPSLDGITALAQLAAWFITAWFLLMGFRPLAIISAWAGVAAAGVWLASELPHWQSDVTMTWWQHLLALMCATALTLAGHKASRSDAVALLGRSRVTVLIAMSALAGTSAALHHVLFGLEFPMRPLSLPWPWLGGMTAGVLLAYAATIAVSLLRVAAGIRRRVLVLLTPSTGMLVATGTHLLDPFLGYGTAANAAVLATTSLLLLAVAAAYSAFHERRAHLIALGRAAELTTGAPGDTAPVTGSSPH